MHFNTPIAFILLLLIPLVIWPWRMRRSGAVQFSSTDNVTRAGKSMRQKLSFLLPVLRGLSLLLLIIALARPQVGTERVRDINKGIAIEVVLDRSSSMGEEMDYKGTRMTRLDAVKNVFRDFVMGDGRGLPGRPNDLVGMISFARYADTICPLTLAHGALEPFLDSIKLVTRRNEDGTSVGDALALAAARLKRAEDTLSLQTGKGNSPDYQIKSKIIILLTDGANNAGKRDPLAAADLAAKWGIKVYAIGIGSSRQSFFGGFMMQPQTADPDTLKMIARKTGGIYRSANSAKALQSIYKEIDELEKSEIESVRFMDYKEQFVPYALLALFFIILEIVLNETVFRKLP
jgi:Ca-activated chloride channel family protein